MHVSMMCIPLLMCQPVTISRFLNECLQNKIKNINSAEIDVNTDGYLVSNASNSSNSIDANLISLNKFPIFNQIHCHSILLTFSLHP